LATVPVGVGVGVGVAGADNGTEAGAPDGATVLEADALAVDAGVPEAGALAAALVIVVEAAGSDVVGEQAVSASPVPRPNTAIPVTDVTRVKCPQPILISSLSSKEPDMLGDDARECLVVGSLRIPRQRVSFWGGWTTQLRPCAARRFTRVAEP
jgi:hypothetical protein